jgi:hypothetical protein
LSLTQSSRAEKKVTEKRREDREEERKRGERDGDERIEREGEILSFCICLYSNIKQLLYLWDIFSS